MEKIVKKLKSKTITVIVLAMLTITWQVINYLTLKDKIDFTDFTSSQTIIIYTSYIILAIFFLAILSLIITSSRLVFKFNSERKKTLKAEKNKTADTNNQNKLKSES